ncbi:hypothetical protein NFI96_015822 [Prochilodus magdalenae]|nr:hypothetical protein NFI96_015822 [Prochilodus magdalenae]
MLNRISGAEVGKRVRSGDDVVLYCDCVLKSGTFIVWFRKSSDEDQTPLIISADVLIQPAFSRHQFIENPTIRTRDLLVEERVWNQGTWVCYHCAVWDRKSVKGGERDVYLNGTRTTRLSLLDPPVHCADPHETPYTLQTTSTPPVSDCNVCWKLLVSVCPVGVLLSSVISSTCVYYICKKRTEGVLFSRISGAEVEMRVRPGDSVTLYCDCVWEVGFTIVWFRNCSHHHQPPLMISATDLTYSALSRYSAVWNPSNQTHDLLLKNVSESDLGLYYCAVHEKKITKDSVGVIRSVDVHHYGNRTTRLSLLGAIAKMESPLLMLPAEVKVLTVRSVLFSRISGAEVEMRVRPGDNVVLYCDCVVRARTFIVWFRKSSDEDQTPLIISADKFTQPAFFVPTIFIKNPSISTRDLLVTNVSESDLGLYYCALWERTSVNGVQRDVYHNGARTTRLSLLEASVLCAVPTSTTTIIQTHPTLQTTSTPPVSDCTGCWKLLFIVCLVGVLLSSVVSSICVYYICKKRTEGTLLVFTVKEKNQREKEKSPNQQIRTREEVGGGDVCYAALDLPSRGQKPLKKKKRRVESSEFSTYSESAAVLSVQSNLWLMGTPRNVPLTWTNQTKTQTSASKTLTIIPHPAPVSEMERSRAVLLTLVCVLFSKISGSEVEMKVRPGDNIVLYCDCVLKAGTFIVWFRKSSDEDRTPLIISAEKLVQPAFSRHHFIKNPSINSWNLLVRNVSESDLGLYYCAVWERKSVHDVYHNGTRTTRLALLGKVGGGDVCYAALDLPSRGQKPLKKKKRRVESSEFSTYSECGWCAAGVLFSRISGAEVEMRVRPGDNVTLYSDCVREPGTSVVWFRKSSDEDQTPLIISGGTLGTAANSCCDLVRNPFLKTYDLLVKNVSKSDLGLYYCAVWQRTPIKDGTGAQGRRDGTRITRLSLLDPPVPCADPHEIPSTLQTTSTPPVSDCSVCWKLLVIVCPIGVLLSSVVFSTCVFYIFGKRTEGVLFSWVSGAEVEMRVRPGDNVVLYSDCVRKFGTLVWFRNSSNENQTPLILSGETLIQAAFSRYCFVWNQVNQTQDLLVKNVSESDLALYYCAHWERKPARNGTVGVLFSRISGAEVEMRVRPGDDVVLY